MRDRSGDYKGVGSLLDTLCCGFHHSLDDDSQQSQTQAKDLYKAVC